MANSIEDHFKSIEEQPGLLTLIDAMGLLSTQSHEGRRLRFAMIYSDGRAWQVVKETISDETLNQNQAGLDSREFSNYLHAHWSIFQMDGIAGFVDKDDVQRHRRGITITKIVRLKNPHNQLPGQLFTQITDDIQGSYVVYSSGDGRVRIFTQGKELIQWNMHTNTVKFVKETVKGIVSTLLSIMDVAHDDDVGQIFEEAIQEISEAEGEGAMLIVSELDLLDSYLQQMDRSERQMVWRKRKPIIAVDKTILRAMMILDGATATKKEQNGERHIESRFVVYPFCDCGKAFSVLRGSYHHRNCPLRDRHNNQLLTLNQFNEEVLVGKGSKHHGAANLSVLLVLKRQSYFHNFITFLQNGRDNPILNLPFRILTISADGGIKEWPNVFKGE